MGDATYEVEFTEDYPGAEMWTLAFSLVTQKIHPSLRVAYPVWRSGITKTGHAFTVFATILAIMKDFVSARHPKEIQFTADEPSRQKLYSRLGRMARSLDPAYSYDSSGEPSRFRVYRTGSAYRSRWEY